MKIRIKLMQRILPDNKLGILGAIETGDADYPDSLDIYETKADAEKESNQVAACNGAAKALRAAAARFERLAESTKDRFMESTHNAINK